MRLRQISWRNLMVNVWDKCAASIDGSPGHGAERSNDHGSPGRATGQLDQHAGNAGPEASIVPLASL